MLGGMKTMPEWKPIGDGSQLVDDKTYLVAWINSIYKCSGPHLVYYDKEEGKFFSLHDHGAFPLQVDMYLEIPEIPRIFGT